MNKKLTGKRLKQLINNLTRESRTWKTREYYGNDDVEANQLRNIRQRGDRLEDILDSIIKE